NYVESMFDRANVMYAGGKGEEEEKLIQKVGESKGIRRIEEYTDISNAEDVTELVTLAKQKLKELEEIKTFEATIIPYNSFYYEKDYDLGDYVTVFDRKLDVKVDAQITEIKEVYDTNGFNIDVTFGNKIPTILDKIKRK
ncbi:phage protein, partial [Gottschalkia purinilytica]